MELSLLLYILYLKLKMAAKTNIRYRNYIGTIQLRILVKTANNKWGRLFVFDKGNVSSLSGTEHTYDAALIWSDSRTAFKVMAAGSDEATFLAAANGKLKVDGMPYFIQWFGDGIKLVIPPKK